MANWLQIKKIIFEAAPRTKNALLKMDGRAANLLNASMKNKKRAGDEREKGSKAEYAFFKKLSNKQNKRSTKIISALRKRGLYNMKSSLDEGSIGRTKAMRKLSNRGTKLNRIKYAIKAGVRYSQKTNDLYSGQKDAYEKDKLIQGMKNLASNVKSHIGLAGIKRMAKGEREHLKRS
jgi:hypothetical protein